MGYKDPEISDSFFFWYYAYILGLVSTYAYRIISKKGHLIFENKLVYFLYDSKSIILVFLGFLVVYIFSLRKINTKAQLMDYVIDDNPFAEKPVTVDNESY